MKELIAFTHPTPELGGMDVGEANGYVAIPEGHPLHGMDYNKIHEEYDILVHGGLTFSDYGNSIKTFPDSTKDKWVIGFDTCHAGDTSAKWPESEVRKEAENLKNQIEQLIKDYEV